jgi:two-component system, OmpR family, KDP operon response regulator KdpE
VANCRVLIVDNDFQVRRVTRTALITHGYEVLEASSGEEALQKLSIQPCDCVLLELVLPGLDGIAACRAVRAISDSCIIVVSASAMEHDKISAFEAGADDYMLKPLAIQELLARIHATTRRKGNGIGTPHILVLDSVSIDFETHRVNAPDRDERLTPKEYELLRFMVSHSGQVLPHRRMLQAVWGPEYGDEVEYLRVFVNQLRNKIEKDAHHPKYLLTEPCIGYRFAPPDEKN